MSLLSMLTSNLPLVFGALLCIYITSKIAAYRKLSKFPGPPLTGISDIPHQIALLGPAAHEWYTRVSNTYGPVARITPNILITSSPELWAHVNKHDDYKRTEWYYHSMRIEHRRDNVFTQTDNALHDARRKQMVAGYSGKENLDLEPAIDQYVGHLVNLLRSKYMSTDERIVPVDLAEKVQFFTLDVISGVGLGRSFGMLKTDTDVDEYGKSSDEGLMLNAKLFALGMSRLAHLPIIGAVLGPSPKDKSGFGKMMATCFRYVDDRASNPTDERSDMLASFIRHGLSGDELRSEALEQIVAGSDTTAGAIRGILLLLMTNRRVYAKLQREIDDAVHKGMVPARSEDAIISGRQSWQLPYLQAVIREGMRVLPSVTNLFCRDVPPHGDEVTVDGDKISLPGGTSIGISFVAMCRNKDVYGEDAGTFRPERWFEPDEERLALMKRISDLSFGVGNWMCLGKPVAQLELPKVVFELSRNFDMALVDATKPWDHRNTMGLFVIRDMWVQVSERRL